MSTSHVKDDCHTAPGDGEQGGPLEYVGFSFFLFCLFAFDS